LFAILALALIVSSHPAFAATASEVSVENVFGTNYLRVVQQEVQAATGSVVVAMFEMRVPQDAAEENPSLVLVNELLDAHRRGVDVDVILNLRSKYDPESDDPVRDHANGIAADMLTYAGVDVAYFPGSYHMHSKFVVIDEKITIIGSHNWTYSGLAQNIESSSLIRSREHAKAKLANIAELETVSAATAVAPDVARTIPVPRAFLLQKNLAPYMQTKNDTRPFDTYLLLRRYATERKSSGDSLTIDIQQLAADLGIDPAKGRTNSRKLAIRPLRRLADHYELIDLKVDYGGDAHVVMRDDPNADVLNVPLAYWTYGLATKLKLAEKLAYLICINEEAQALTPPLWMRSQEELSEKYAISISPINNGLNGLQRHDILEIIRSPISTTGNYKKRRPNQYRLKPLLSPQERVARWKKLEEKHGPEIVAQARGLATMLDYGNSIESADQLATAITAYGYQTTSNTTATVATRSLTNPNRHPNTVVEYLHNTRSNR